MIVEESDHFFFDIKFISKFLFVFYAIGFGHITNILNNSTTEKSNFKESSKIINDFI